MHPYRPTRAGLLGLIALALALAAPAANAQSSGTAPAKPASQKHRAAPTSQTSPIVCTKYGCKPLPAHCHAETEFTWDGDPTGYQRIVCP